ncbi:MAG: PH domain-containing protein [Patescibacteria group bacterium]
MIDLYPEEKIILIERKHWLPISIEGLSFSMAGILPFLAIGIADSLPQSIKLVIDHYRLNYLFFSSAWLLVIWVLFFMAWTKYYLDIFIVTTKRIVDINQISLFSRDVSEMKLEHIQDINYKVNGLLASLMKFGDVHIQSAGEKNEFVIRNISNPDKLCEAISKQHLESLKG